MVNQVAVSDLWPPVILVGLSGFLAAYFFYSRRVSGVNALDWFIATFTATFLMGVFQIFKLFFEGDWLLFKYSSDAHSLITNPVRLMHLTALLVLFFMAEYFINDRINFFRGSVLAALLGTQVFLAIYYVTTGKLILTKEILPFAQNTTFDGLLFDLLSLEVSIILQYVYFRQLKLTTDKQIRKYLIIFNITLLIFNIGNLIEIAEHFFPIGDINAFITVLPVFLILAVFYIRYPNFVYLSPSRIKFLQMISNNGELLYAVEISQSTGSREFLIAPIFASVNSLIGELVGQKQIEMNAYHYNGGVILLENLENVQVIVQTERPAKILRRSMRYFIREFHRYFHDQINNFDGSIQKENGVDPDSILRKCIPIVQSEVIISSYRS